jgi:AraC-like DNA-binding protein
MKNFDQTRKGIMLQSYFDFSGDMGAAYERCIDFKKGHHKNSRMVICFARGATSAISEISHSKEHLSNDKTSIVIKAAGLRHQVWSLTKVYDDLALFPSEEFILRLGKKNSVHLQDIEQFLSFSGVLKRTPWLNSLIEEYFVRRILKGEKSETLQFFQEELMMETIRLTLPSKAENLTAKLTDQGENKVLNFIEANLFISLSLGQIAQSLGLGLSGLNRYFKNNLNMTPAQYIKKRRMEEAMRLIKESNKGIDEISFLVGYENTSSFGRVFKSIFGNTPASFR